MVDRALALQATGTSPSDDAASETIGDPDSRDIIIEFHASDGTPLVAKLTLPAADPDATPEGAANSAPLPVVFYCHGASPRTYDHTLRYRDADGAIKTMNYLDSYAGQLAQRGIAFFRMSKRGCTLTAEPPYMTVDRDVFSKATLSVLVDDYAAALDVLRARPEIDPARIVLLGTSEGTRAAPLLAAKSPEGIIGVVMMAYAADNCRGTVEWQNTLGPWRNIMYMIPAARDGELTRPEHEELAATRPDLAGALPFDVIDANDDDLVRPEDFEQLNKPRYEYVVKCIEEGNDDWLWDNLLNLTSAYMKDWWDAPANVENLLALDENVSLAIFHGTLDAACRVEGVRETEARFKEEGRANLTVRIYENSNHDLDWTPQSVADGGPPAFRDAFDWIAERLK